MFRLISNMPISRRLLLAFAITAMISGIVIVSLGTYYLNALSVRSQVVQTSFDAQNIAQGQLINLESMHTSLETSFGLVFAEIGGVSKDPAGITKEPTLGVLGQETMLNIEQRKAIFDQALKRYQTDYSLATSPNMNTIRSIILSDTSNSDIIRLQTSALSTTANHWSTYQDLQSQILQLLGKDLSSYTNGSLTHVFGAYQAAYKEVSAADTVFTMLRNTWQNVVNISEQMGKVVTTVGSSQLNPIIITAVIGFLSTMLIIITTGFIVNLTITRPLRQLANLTKRIAKGETNARATISGHDEIYMVATSMNNMLDNIVRLIQETQAQRDNLQGQVEKLVSEVSGVGEGDLRVEAEVTADALGVLADSFNYMVEELSSLVVRVKMVANEVANTTTAIMDRMTQLVETSDNEIRQIGDAADEIERVAGTSRQVAERAKQLTDIARNARQDAKGGRDAVQQAVLGMGRINENVQETAGKVQTLGERSREIDEIVSAISGIAHQTNRLALDAAIQAAMAGENGKGFGAVAADIRRLAERAKEQAGSITRIVRSVREDIEAAATAMQDTERETFAETKLTQEAGNALESIFAAVEYQAREIENINDMAGQQLRSTNAVVQIMQGVIGSSQHSGTSSRDASQNMEHLARLVEQLRSSVEAFKLRENQGFLLPSSNNVSIMEEQEDSMTISGLFRTVSATAQPAHLTQLTGVGTQNNLLPPRYDNSPNGNRNW